MQKKTLTKSKTKTHLDCTSKEDALAREVALTTNSLQVCYETAGYSGCGQAGRNTARNILQRTHVSERLDYYKSMAAAKLDIRNERIMAEFSAIAFSDPMDVFEVNDDGVMRVRTLEEIPPWARRAIMSIKQVTKSLSRNNDEDVYETTLEIKFHPKVQALTKLAELKNMFKENNKSLAPKVHLDLTFQGAR